MGQWEKHKYIAVINGRYIYPNSSQNTSRLGGNSILTTISSDTGSGIIGGDNAGNSNSSVGSGSFNIQKGNTSVSKKPGIGQNMQAKVQSQTHKAKARTIVGKNKSQPISKLSPGTVKKGNNFVAAVKQKGGVRNRGSMA